MQFVVFHFFVHVLKGVDHHDPAVFVLDVFVPFFVVIVVPTVEIQHVFTNENIAVNAFFDHKIHQIALEKDAVVVQAIVPFANHFDDGVALLVIGKQDFEVQGMRSKKVPLRVDVKIVNLVGVIKLAVLSPIKWGLDVFSSHIIISPAVVRFKILHGIKNLY